MIFNLKKYST